MRCSGGILLGAGSTSPSAGSKAAFSTAAPSSASISGAGPGGGVEGSATARAETRIAAMMLLITSVYLLLDMCMIIISV
jgi:hypothetical protein